MDHITLPLQAIHRSQHSGKLHITGEYRVAEPDGNILCVCLTREKAEELVQAVNAYDRLVSLYNRLSAQNFQLVAACKALLAAGESGLMNDWYSAREQTHAALAAVEEKHA